MKMLRYLCLRGKLGFIVCREPEQVKLSLRKKARWAFVSRG